MKIVLLALQVASMVILFRVEPPSYDAFVHRPLLYLNPEILSSDLFDLEALFPGEYANPIVGADVSYQWPFDNWPGCKLEIIERVDYDNYYAVVRGFLFSLIVDASYDPEDCLVCMKLANEVGSLQEALVGFYAAKNVWGDMDKILNLSLIHI